MWSMITGIFIFCCLIHPLLGATVNHRCLICNSTDLGCEEGLSRFVENCSQDTDGCFTRVVDGMLIRGCLSQLPNAEERQQCAQVEGGACISCTEDECNRHSWLKCVQCDDGEQAHENCTDKQQAHFCHQYRSEDHCYKMTRVVNDQDQPQMVRNCLSTLEIAGMQCNQSEQCVILSTNDGKVNMLAAADTSSKCLVCTSEELNEGEKCVQGTSEAQDCLQPNDKCFSRLQGDVLQRNCLSTLTTEEQEVCADSNDATCLTCDTAGCNTDRLPRCLQCKKSVDINCADPSMSSALKATFCPRFQSSSSCYSRLVVDEVERGCTSTPGLPENVCEGNKKCLICTDDGCNVISDSDLMNVQTCVRCGSRNGDNVACENAAVEPVECDGLIDECYTRIQDGIVERNCLSTLSEEDQVKCKDDADMTCVTCIGHHCNDYTWLRCYRCSKQQEQRCAAPESNDLSVALCDGFQQQGECFAKIVDEDVVRGCVIDLGSHVDVCEDNPMCSVCPFDGCNSVDEDTLRRYTKCITCTTSTAEGKEACESADLTTTAVVCGELDDVCFTRVKDGHLERGCLSSLDDEGQQQCKDPNDAACNTCQDLSCNNARWLKCAKCTSSENPSCAVLEEPALQELSSYCARHSSQSTCYSKVVQDVLERGCTLEQDGTESVCQGSTGCATCASDNCNTHTKEALLSETKCVQCTSHGVESDCNGELPNPEPCSNKNDRCFSRVADGTLTRNCFSTLDASAQAACSNPGDLSCIICEESGCNQNHWVKCHQCDQTTHAACGDEQQASDSAYCKSYHAEDKCYTKIMNDRLERGCQSDAGSGVDICSDADVCLTCQEDACNNAPGSSLVYTKCQQCTSSEDPECALGAVQSKSCPLQNDPCYTAVNSDNTLVRGCLSMLNEELRAACNDEDNLSCITCAESDCNGLQWPSCYRCKSSTDAKDCIGDESTVCENNNRCVACSSPGCNSITKEALEAVHTCYQCDSSDGNCDLALEGHAKECSNRNDRCYMKLSEGVLTRGCLSDIDAEECDGNVQCMVCDGQDCNSLSWPKCYQCSNTTSVDCSQAQQDSVNLNYCHHYSETACFAMTEANSYGTLYRGCFSHIRESHKGKCTDSTDKTCVTCNGNSCNREPWRLCIQCRSVELGNYCSREASPLKSRHCKRYKQDDGCYAKEIDGVDDRFYCHTCISSSYMDCVWNPSTSLTKDCTAGDRACATVILPNGHIYRGCSQDEECVTAGDDCIKCDIYSGCNIDRYPADRLRCNICQSSLSASCRALPYERQFEKPCIRYVSGDQCVTVFDQFNVSYRNCMSAVLEADQLKCADRGTAECVVCSRMNCNTAKVRVDDRCLQCTSNMTNCSNGKRPATVCKAPSEGKCYSRVDEHGFLHRGCLVDLEADIQASCAKDARNCAICDGEGCNASFLPENTLSCVQCDSRETLYCAQQQQNDSFVGLCRRHVELDRCYTRTTTGGNLQRGCESDLPEDSGCTVNSATSCELCSGNDCNRNVFPTDRLSCYQCNSEQQTRCGAEQSVYNLERALLCRFHLENDGCFTKVNGDEVSRGCISDLEGTSVCDGLPSNECRTCYGADCNSFSDTAIRNSASHNVCAKIITCLLLFAFVKLKLFF
uniref:DUF753 domain-containing protein n=1 Tax=Anopheles atroparvus TaxID=41427 RepID=A0A182J6I2_ANOAO